MPIAATPAIRAFCEAFPGEVIFGQVQIRRERSGFDLRHVADSPLARDHLSLLNLSDLRRTAQWTESRQYRPLKSAPNLPAGWRFFAADMATLEEALNRLYPGAIADWFAARTPEPPVTHFRTFTARQTGMYRMTQLLTGRQAGQIVRAGCHRKFCLKQRLWNVEEAPADLPEQKSLIPCLEPCALLLEFARRGLRMAQEEAVGLEVCRSDLATLEEALQAVILHPPFVPEADFTAPGNPRRAQLVREKLPRAALAAEEPNLEENL